MGGRQRRIGPDYGEIFDHHSIEFTFADGMKMFSFCRHIPGCWNSFSEHAHGTSELTVEGQEPQRWRRTADGHQVEHDDLFAALKAGQRYNECDATLPSTMTAILGRMATYSGKVVTWDDAWNSGLDLAPAHFTWDAQPKVEPGPEGLYPCAVPGVTEAF